MGLVAVAVNVNTYDATLHKVQYSKWMLDWVINEAHCISQWGGDFRLAYGKLNRLRFYVPLDTPIYMTSAMIPPIVLQEVCDKLQISTTKSFQLNLGNNQPNVTYETRTIPNTTDFLVLDFLYKDAQIPEDMLHTFVFVNTVQNSMAGWRQACEVLLEHLRHCVDFLNSCQSPAAKKTVLEKYRKGEIYILFVTKVGGMIQRSGQAGHSPIIQATTLLLVQALVFQVVGGSKANESSDSEQEEREISYCKNNVEAILHEWIETQGCCRDIIDRYFDNPRNRTPTLESLRHALGPSWAMLEQYASEVLSLLVEVDSDHIKQCEVVRIAEQQCKNKEQAHVEREHTWAEKENISGVLLFQIDLIVTSSPASTSFCGASDGYFVA
ncbi:hypothetical protein F5I97DRAFT_1827699 [Phlebopus sp. FC_14]|nr:hypothetical protein F5I97DRAFT_1827699 [Phlebopus sp. FC_14]